MLCASAFFALHQWIGEIDLSSLHSPFSYKSQFHQQLGESPVQWVANQTHDRLNVGSNLGSSNIRWKLYRSHPRIDSCTRSWLNYEKNIFKYPNGAPLKHTFAAILYTCNDCTLALCVIWLVKLTPWVQFLTYYNNLQRNAQGWTLQTVWKSRKENELVINRTSFKNTITSTKTNFKAHNSSPNIVVTHKRVNPKWREAVARSTTWPESTPCNTLLCVVLEACQ